MELPADGAASRHRDLLQRSLQSLDEAIQRDSPSGIIRTRRSLSNRFGSRRSVGTRRSDGLDDITENITVDTANVRMSILGDLTQMEDSILEEPELTLDATSALLLTDTDPAEKAIGDLYSGFLASVRKYPAEHEVFEQLAEYQEACSRQVDRLCHLITRVPAQRGERRLLRTRQLLDQLSKERNTWRLLASLYADRLLVESADADVRMLENVGKPRSDKQIVDSLFECDTQVRQAQLVVDWLENCASDDLLSTFHDKVEFYGETAGAWENTLHSLVTGARAARELVTEMDPDAAVRQQKPLHDLDKEDEQRLLRYMFVLLRAGQMDQAQRLCMKVGQPWRAAALEGWKLYHDPNFDQSGPQPQPVQGNRLRDLWKLTAWQLAEDTRLDPHERAIYGSLCGSLSTLLPVCESWEDRVWSYYKVLVDSHVECEVRGNTQSLRDLKPTPPQHDELSRLTPEDVFREVDALEAGKKSPDRDPVLDLYNTVQKYAILGDEAAMVGELILFCKEEDANDQYLRAAAHIVLFMRRIGADVINDDCVTVLEAYVKSLIERRAVALVAWYTGYLPQPAQVGWYAALMETVLETEERLETLRLAELAGLDVQAACRAAVEAARRRPSPSPSAQLVPETTDDDRRRIDALEWLLFDPAQRPEALRQGNALCRTFLLAHKLTAAKLLMEMLPDDSVAIVLDLWKKATGESELPPEQDNVVKEHLCVKAFLLAQDAYIDWSEQFHHQRPREPLLRSGASFTEQVAHEQKVKLYRSSLERWRAAHLALTKTTTERLYNVLLFPDGGWMADRPLPPTAPPAAVDGDDESERQRQMAALRQTYLPQTVSVLQRVLQCAEKYREAVQLADLVASEQYQLYREFTQQELQNFLGKLRETSLELLDKNMDALGYPFQ